ncbi:uncharacterized protein VP01_613g1 [Puccinia sorghi]|uniref:BZIP domain-containing protein n=1 Tax=Puccinia sorghi TaxID=27349 RepID=A0A0L6UGV6_9BASI|nr:uncharacterized protein VP01_613g1 [Puccinia sorghi]
MNFLVDPVPFQHELDLQQDSIVEPTAQQEQQQQQLTPLIEQRAVLLPDLFADHNNNNLLLNTLDFPFINLSDPFNPNKPIQNNSILPNHNPSSWTEHDHNNNNLGLIQFSNPEPPLPHSNLTIQNSLVLEPVFNNLDPLLSNNHTVNSIDCWIDFTGGGSITNCPLIVDHQPWVISPLPTPSAPVTQTQRPPQLAPNRVSLKRQCTEKVDAPTRSAPSTVSPPAQTGSNKKGAKKKPKVTAVSRRKKADARHDFLERNRLAASRSRAKKKSYQQFLEERAHRLEQEQARLNLIILDLVAEKDHLKHLLDQLPHPPLHHH